jgi:nanoRNase/pAp phosphatase (c-di-AMP/oligoRNAs hydrolase)
MEPKAAPQVPPRLTWNDAINQVNNFLTAAKEVLVLIRPTPRIDAVLGALGLVAAIKKTGRRAQIVCPTKINEDEILDAVKNEKSLPPLDLDQILNFLPAKQLVLTVDYRDGSFSNGRIQKSPEGMVLTLLPKENERPIEPLKIDSAIYESEPNLIFTLEVENLSHLGELYLQNKQLFSKISVVDIDYHNNNADYGAVNLIDVNASSICEMVALMLYDLRFIFDNEIARILYTGMKLKTDNFQEFRFSANMLEAASICMRSFVSDIKKFDESQPQAAYGSIE